VAATLLAGWSTVMAIHPGINPPRGRPLTLLTCKTIPLSPDAALGAAAAATLAGAACVTGVLQPDRSGHQPAGERQHRAGDRNPAASGRRAPQTSGERTVLVQEGLRIHSSASLSSAVEGRRPGE